MHPQTRHSQGIALNHKIKFRFIFANKDICIIYNKLNKKFNESEL